MSDELCDLMNSLDLIKSTKNKDLLVFNNYVYKIDYVASSSNKHNWRCNEKADCKARCYTIGLNPPVTTNDIEHNHAAKPARIEVRKCVNDMLKMANDTKGGSRKIIQQAQKQLSQEAAAICPSYEALRQRINRNRTNEYDNMVLPKSLAEIDIPDEFKVTCNNDLFLRFDSGSDDPNRFMVFATEKNLELLDEFGNWLMDGTFDPAADLFFQLFTIHIIKKGKNLPCVYALLPNKTQKSYERLFEYIRKQVDNCPDSVSLDFELGLINAAKDKFDNVKTYGCFFHFKQSLWRNIQHHGFAGIHNNDNNARIFFRKLAVLAFVPVPDVVFAFDKLKFSEELYFKEFNTFIKYFEQNYIGEQKRGRGVGRKEPRFPHVLWNVYDRNIEGLPRTNNNIEG